MERQTLEELDTFYQCARCRKMYNIKDMVKVEKFSLFKPSFKILCKECVKK